MLGLISDLFRRDTLIVHGVAESHPASILNSTFEMLGLNFEGEAADGPIDTELLKEMARDVRVENDYWTFWKDMVRTLPQHSRLTQWALASIGEAESISLEERRIVHILKPKKLYIEGCIKYPSSVIGFVAHYAGRRCLSR